MSFLCTFDEPVVQTRAGRLRGFMMDEIYQFRGVRYAEAERFLPPTPVEPWEGIKDAASYGYGCPTINRPGLKPYGMDFGMRYWPQNEACQYLNIWTPTLDETAKKPVMFWIHGGGFSDGSALELVSYDGENLSREGDMVVVSINHRLNILGYLNLSAYGEKYALSATAGMADIIMALRWVQENIARFGGDPDNVTIFGQSGGGMKVDTLMQMPEAAGLFHKAMIESGITDLLHSSPEDSRKVADAVVDELGLTLETIDEIQRVPYDELAQAWKRAAARLSKEGVSTDWAPVPNASYPGGPMQAGFSEKAKHTPLVVGCVVAEQLLWRGRLYDPAASEETKLRLIREFYGDEGAEVLLPEFRKAYPDKDINDLLYLDSRFRKPTIEYLDARVRVAEAPTYSWMLTYDFPIYGGLPAWHGSNHALTFNQCIAPVFHEPGSRKLAVQFSQSYAAFAHSGDPNCKEIPAWSPYETGHEATMIFDSTCVEKIDYDRALMLAHDKYVPQMILKPSF